jgi:hypothetical protein
VSLLLLLSWALLCLSKINATLAAMMASTMMSSINENPSSCRFFMVMNPSVENRFGVLHWNPKSYFWDIEKTWFEACFQPFLGNRLNPSWMLMGTGGHWWRNV